MSDLRDDLEFSDSQLYASFDAFKTLVDAGVSRKEALERVGLSEQMLKDLEEEEESSEFKDEFIEVWDDGDDFDDEFGDDSGFGEDFGDDDEFGGGSGFDDFD